jgi:hypothetical protein
MKPALLPAIAIALAALSGVCQAEPARDAIVKSLADQAKAADPAFTAFSAENGKAFWAAKHEGGKPDTPSCTSCHTADPRQPGQTRAGKTIDPMAVSVNPARFTEADKVEKWFVRNCNSVLGRECTPQEKGDVLTYLSSQ